VTNPIALVATLLVIGTLCGCGTSPQERFFTLSSDLPAQAATAARERTYLIVVGPVTVPDLVDRPQFVLRSGSRVEIAEQARWAAPLKSEIARVIADHLARLVDDARTATSEQRAAGAADYRVLIDIQRFDSAPQQDATIQALWTVRGKNAEPLSGSSLVSEPAGVGYDALVAAHGRGLSRISRDIAAAISGLRARAQ
jgi:uncharacterized lipoprotein YmbA